VSENKEYHGISSLMSGWEGG